MSNKAILCLLLTMGMSMPALVRAVGEYELKAAFLYNFSLFTEWPQQPSILKLCVMGKDPFGGAIRNVAEKTVHGAALKVLRVSSITEARTCQLLFVAASERDRLNQISEQLRYDPVLTVTESDGYDQRQAMIVMVNADHHVEFDINQTAAQQAGLRLSSRLLKLARKVW